jgi:hypothetical protein
MRSLRNTPTSFVLAFIQLFRHSMRVFGKIHTMQAGNYQYFWLHLLAMLRSVV